MRTIAIVGAGQAGLQLGITLLKNNHQVILFSPRSATQVLEGSILSNQAMFHSALQLERKYNLHFWDKECPQNQFITFTLATPNDPSIAFQWRGSTYHPYHSVDQRMKFSRWMQEFEQLGGCLNIQHVGIKDLVKISKQHELTIVACGKGEISQGFPKNVLRSYYARPQRVLSCLYVKGVVPVPDYAGVRVNVIPNVGECFIMPGLTKNGPCEMMLFEGIPQGPFDCWWDICAPDEQLQKSLQLLQRFVPWEAERCQYAQLTDQGATLLGSYTPCVRDSILKLPNGELVLGIGDTVVLNDPIAGQGANNASKAAEFYLAQIMKRGNKPFDEEWMSNIFEYHWHHDAKWSTYWSNLLLAPPEQHILELLHAATECPAIANVLANGFDDPATLFPWIMHPAETRRLITIIKEQSNQYMKIKTIEGQ